MSFYTNIIATNICNASGTKLAAGTLYFQATDATNVPIAFQPGGGGQAVNTPVSASITNGTVGNSFFVADPSQTIPAGIFYHIWAVDSSTNQVVLDYALVSFAGPTFTLDNYASSGLAVNPPVGQTVSGPLVVNGSLSVTGTLLSGQPGAGATAVLGTFSLPATTWTITHNMGTQAVAVYCYDNSFNQIIPDNIQNNSVNQTTIKFLQNQTGYAVCFNVGNWTPSVSSPNNIIGNPISSQAINGNFPFTINGGSLFATRIEGHKYADQYATGSGSSNDTVGIQNALNDAAGSTLHFPSGKTFRNDGTATWTVPANTTVIFDDATAKAVLYSGGTNVMLFTLGGNNITFINPQISDTRGFSSSTTGAYGIWCQGRSNFQVLGGFATGFTYSAIGLEDSSAIRIIGFRADSIGSKFNAGGANQDGRAIVLIASSPSGVGNTDVIISGCQLTNSGYGGIGSSSFSSNYAVDGLVISGCHVEGSGATGIEMSDMRNAIITGNVSSRNGFGTINLGEGIHAYGANHSATPCTDFAITGNTCYGNNENGIEASFQVKNFSITGNTCNNNTFYGIKTVDVAQDGVISGNHCGNNALHGIELSTALTSKSDGVTNGTSTFTSATANFSSADVGKNIVIQNGNTGSAVYVGTISAFVNSTTVTLASPAPTSSSSGLTFYYGFFMRRISLTGNHCHDNGWSGIDISGCFDVTVSGGQYYRNGKTSANRYGVVFAEGQRGYIRGVHCYDDQTSPTQQYGVFAYAADTVVAEQVSGYGNVSGLISLNNGSATNTFSDTGSGNLVRATSPTLSTPTLSGTPTETSVTLGIGNGAGTNVTAPAKSTGSGPASLVAVEWEQVSVNGTTYWRPLFQ